MSTKPRPQARDEARESPKAPGQQLFVCRHGDETRAQQHSAAGRVLDADDPCGLSPGEVREQLQRILASPSFEASERRKRFLRYAVEEMLAGRADRLKGYSIATAVFDRDDSFDPQTDPVVRLEAGRLRRALEHYYLTAGRDDPVRVDIPKGSYVPTCERQSALPGSPAACVERASSPPVVQLAPSDREGIRPYFRAATRSTVALGAALVLAAAVGWFWLARAPLDLSIAQQLGEGPAVIVLPFASLSETAADHRFARGLTEELIADLTRFEDMRVYQADEDFLERRLFDPAALGQQPEGHYLVKGSVRHTASGMRAIVHLIDLGSGRHLWSETYERSLTDDNSVALEKALGAELATQLVEPHGIVRQVTAGVPAENRPELLRTCDCISQAYAYRRTFSRDLYLSTRDCLAGC